MQITRKPNGQGTLDVTVKVEGEDTYKYDGIFVDTISDEALERALIRCTANDRWRRWRKEAHKAFLAQEREGSSC